MKWIKNLLMKYFDLIERKDACWFVELDNKKMQQAISILKSRLQKIINNPKIKQHRKEKLIIAIDEIIMVARFISENHVLKLKEVRKMTEDEFVDNEKGFKEKNNKVVNCQKKENNSGKEKTI